MRSFKYSVFGIQSLEGEENGIHRLHGLEGLFFKCRTLKTFLEDRAKKLSNSLRKICVNPCNLWIKSSVCVSASLRELTLQVSRNICTSRKEQASCLRSQDLNPQWPAVLPGFKNNPSNLRVNSFISSQLLSQTTDYRILNAQRARLAS